MRDDGFLSVLLTTYSNSSAAADQRLLVSSLHEPKKNPLLEDPGAICTHHLGSSLASYTPVSTGLRASPGVATQLVRSGYYITILPV